MPGLGDVRISAAAATGLLVAAALAVAPGAGGSPAASACTFGGIRYVGTTSQKKPLCLTLSGNRKLVREYTFDYADTCGTGTARAQNPRAGVMPVTPAGVFVRTAFDGYFKGVARGAGASGSLRQTGKVNIPGRGTVTCDTHVVRWTAHRVG